MKECKHFFECGGCRFQDTPYPEQLIQKENTVKDLASLFSTEVKPINSAKPWYYRGKMEFTFSFDKGTICGLYSKVNRGKVLDVEECLIFSEDLPVLFKTIKAFVNKKKYLVYDKYSHQGFLRNLVIRQTKFGNELMLGIVTTSVQNLDKEELVRELLSLKLNTFLKSIYWIINDSLSDAVVFERKELLYGEETIKEQIDGLTFNIGIDSFFQVNSYMLSDFYKKINDYSQVSSDKRVLDLFCGVGTIGISLAKQAKFVWAVEISQEIIDLAWKNAKENNIENISFFAADARRFLNTQGMFYRGIETLVLNPPRAGLSNKIIRAILRLKAKNIIYSSCNPKALFLDLEKFTDHYSLDFIEPFDFFPHTPHLECLASLRKK